LGRKDVRKDTHDPGRKFRRPQIGLEYGAPGIFGFLEKFPLWRQIMGKNATGDRVGEHLFDGFELSLTGKFSQVRNFPASEKLYTLGRKGFVKPGQGQPRPVQIRNIDLPAQALAASYTMEVKGVVFLEVYIDKIQNGELLYRHTCIIIEKAGLVNRQDKRIELPRRPCPQTLAMTGGKTPEE
jgi:hypothetical protein